MAKFELSEDTRYGLIFVFSLLGLLAAMLLLNYFLGGDKKTPAAEKVKEKTVIVSEAKPDTAPPKPLPASVVSTVRDALKKGNYSTAHMEINHNVSKSSPEYEALRKELAEAAKQRKTPGVRKDSGASPSAPVRYFDESTPRDRASDAIYIYFVDISGILTPRFCIQAASKRPLGITRFTIATDTRSFEIMASPLKQENTGKGVAEWYDVPLDGRGYEAVQAMIKAKKATLTISGTNGKRTRDVTDNEKKGFRRILDGYTALGGSLNYLQDKAAPSPSPKKRT